MAKVSVVIPAFNAESFILETLHSVLDSSYSDISVVVINDGSTDGTEDIVKTISDDRVVLFNRNNFGMSASRNFGINSNESEFIALVDSDDIWHPRKIELQVGLMERHPEIGLCFSEFSKYYGGDISDFSTSSVTDEVDPDLSGFIYHKMIMTNWALPSSVLFRRSLWEEIGPFLCQDQQTDDWEYFVRASRCFKFAKIKSSLVLYRQPLNSLSRRVPEFNSTEMMRNSLIDKFGLSGPQGELVDPIELKNRRYIGIRNFCDLQLSRGDWFKGFCGFLDLFICHDNKIATAITFVKSCRCRIFGWFLQN